VVVEEGWRYAGFGAEIADRVQRERFDSLDAPVVRVTAADVPMPYSRMLEKAFLPQPEKVVRGGQTGALPMITKVVLAKLSPTMEEGTIVKWNKKEGDAIKVGDVLAEIETDKANMEMEALGSGILRKVLVQAGGKAPVGALIGVIADPNEDIAAMLAEAPGEGSAPSTSARPRPPRPRRPRPASRPRRLRLPRRPLRPGPGRSQAGGGRVKASPLARAMAASQNVPLEQVAGSGPGGRIVKRDIEGYLAAPPTLAPAPAAQPAPPAAARPSRPPIPVPAVPPGTVIPLTSMRRTIAKRLSESMYTAPHFYVTVEIDMDAAVDLRERILEAEDVKVSYNDSS